MFKYSETLLDWESITKLSDETHRQFFERLLQHAKQHLAPANVKVEHLQNNVPDTMSISLMNMVALQWLRKCNPALISIVKTEYSTELRDNVQLAALVPRIAPNIESLLKRYDQDFTANHITVNKIENETVDTHLVESTLGKSSFSNSRGRGSSLQRGRGQFTSKSKKNTQNKNVFCPGCYYLSQQLKTPVHFNHLPSNCPRQSVTVKMLEMEDQYCFPEDESENVVGKISSNNDVLHEIFQESTLNDVIKEAKNDIGQPAEYTSIQAVTNVETFEDSTICDVEANVVQISDISVNSHEINPKVDSTIDDLEAKVRRLEERMKIWSSNGVRKSKSPSIAVTLFGTLISTILTIDEGSEINCLDEGFAARSGIHFVPTSCMAKAAGSSSMHLAGQTQKDISFKVDVEGHEIMLHLGCMVVVKNLGCDVLLGEPGKVDNKIITIPHKSLIEFANTSKKRIMLPYCSKPKSPNKIVHLKSNSKQVVYPKQSLLIQLPSSIKEKEVFVIPKSSQTWIRPSIYKVDEYNQIELKNEENFPVALMRLEHYADVYQCAQVEKEAICEEKILKIYDLNRRDLSHLIPVNTEDEKSSYLHEIQIDPDNIMPKNWKDKFRSLCEKFECLFTPRPGRYNGYYGRIDNSINFSSIPPPSIKARLPKY